MPESGAWQASAFGNGKGIGTSITIPCTTALTFETSLSAKLCLIF